MSWQAIAPTAFVSVPWDELSRDGRAGLLWAAAGLGAVVPAALAAIRWVEAWRGSPRFGAPRCRSCRAALRGEGRSLPLRCQECGATASADGALQVDYAVRVWRPGPVLVRFLVGALLIVAAIGGGWFGGASMGALMRAYSVTSRAGMVEPALTRARSRVLANEALRFAADAAANDPAIRAEADAALRAYEAGRIAQGRGLRLLLDRLDLAESRELLLDLLTTLGALGTVDEERLRWWLDRAFGLPSIVGPGAVRRGTTPTYTLSADGQRRLEPACTGVWVNGRALGPDEWTLLSGEFGVDGITLTSLGRASAAPSSGEGGAATLDLEFGWRLTWQVAAAGSSAAPMYGVLNGRIRRTIAVVDGPEVPSVLPSREVPPFLARDLRPLFRVRSLGNATLIRGQLDAAVRPEVHFSGQWFLEVDGERFPITCAVGPSGCELVTCALVPRRVTDRRLRWALVYDPASRPWSSLLPGGSESADRSAAGWPDPVRFDDVAWQWADD